MWKLNSSKNLDEGLPGFGAGGWWTPGLLKGQEQDSSADGERKKEEKRDRGKKKEGENEEKKREKKTGEKEKSRVDNSL